MVTSRTVSRRGFDRQTADWLREAIVAERFEPGQKLTEAAVAQEVGVSRSTARTAFLHLEVEGLVTRQAYSNWAVAGLSARDAWEIYVLRRSLDGLAARLAAESSTNEGRALIHAAHEQMIRTPARDDVLGLARADVAFHSAIVDASNHRRLRQQYDMILGINLLYISRTRVHFQHSHQFLIDTHLEILEAINKGDAQGAQSLAEHHVDINGTALVKLLQEQGMG